MNGAVRRRHNFATAGDAPGELVSSAEVGKMVIRLDAVAYPGFNKNPKIKGLTARAGLILEEKRRNRD